MLGVHPLMGHNGGPSLNVADVFSTDLYTGNGSAQTITNGLNLAGFGGLVWTKNRSNSFDHFLADTVRGPLDILRTNTSGASSNVNGSVTAFASMGHYVDFSSGVGAAGSTYVAWSFRRAAKFFDIVNWTGNGTTFRAIPHSLGITPGLIVVKRMDADGPFFVLARCSNGDYVSSWTDGSVIFGLNSTNYSSTVGANTIANYIKDQTFDPILISQNPSLNITSATYVAYLFAHDAASDGVIKCGSYAGNGSSTGPVVNLGWMPQWLLIKRYDGINSWLIYDNARNTSNPRNNILNPNSNGAENASTFNIDFTSTGFQPVTSAEPVNGSGPNYIYMAIRAEGV